MLDLLEIWSTCSRTIKYPSKKLDSETLILCKALLLIQHILCYFRNAVITVTGFDRPNLYLAVNLKSSNVVDDLREMFVRDGSTITFEGPTIIYCPTKKATEKVAAELAGKFKFKFYCSIFFLLGKEILSRCSLCWMKLLNIATLYAAGPCHWSYEEGSSLWCVGKYRGWLLAW